MIRARMKPSLLRALPPARSSCRYMPWPRRAADASSTIAPVSPSCRSLSAMVPRRPAWRVRVLGVRPPPPRPSRSGAACGAICVRQAGWPAATCSAKAAASCRIGAAGSRARPWPCRRGRSAAGHSVSSLSVFIDAFSGVSPRGAATSVRRRRRPALPASQLIEEIVGVLTVAEGAAAAGGELDEERRPPDVLSTRAGVSEHCRAWPLGGMCFAVHAAGRSRSARRRSAMRAPTAQSNGRAARCRTAHAASTSRRPRSGILARRRRFLTYWWPVCVAFRRLGIATSRAAIRRLGVRRGGRTRRIVPRVASTITVVPSAQLPSALFGAGPERQVRSAGRYRCSSGLAGPAQNQPPMTRPQSSIDQPRGSRPP